MDTANRYSKIFETFTRVAHRGHWDVLDVRRNIVSAYRHIDAYLYAPLTHDLVSVAISTLGDGVCNELLYPVRANAHFDGSSLIETRAERLAYVDIVKDRVYLVDTRVLRDWVGEVYKGRPLVDLGRGVMGNRIPIEQLKGSSFMAIWTMEA